MEDTNKSLGFIGTGAISHALISGMIQHGQIQWPVLVSKRSSGRSAELDRRFSNVTVCDSNQTIVDRSDWVFLAVLPQQARDVIQQLEFKRETTLISLVAGIAVEELKALAGVDRAHRIIPLPPIEFGVGPLPLFPHDPEIAELFNRFGQTVSLENESHFSTFSAASAFMATHHRLTATVADWIVKQGVDRKSAVTYASHMVRSLAELETQTDQAQFADLADECLTAGGLNEQVLHELESENWFTTLAMRLDRIAERLK